MAARCWSLHTDAKLSDAANKVCMRVRARVRGTDLVIPDPSHPRGHASCFSFAHACTQHGVATLPRTCDDIVERVSAWAAMQKNAARPRYDSALDSAIDSAIDSSDSNDSAVDSSLDSSDSNDSSSIEDSSNFGPFAVNGYYPLSVSYTHLTLPTICSV